MRFHTEYFYPWKFPCAVTDLLFFMTQAFYHLAIERNSIQRKSGEIASLFLSTHSALKINVGSLSLRKRLDFKTTIAKQNRTFRASKVKFRILTWTGEDH